MTGSQKTKVIIRLDGGGVGEIEVRGPLRAIKISESFAGTIGANIDQINTLTLDKGGSFSAVDGQILLAGNVNAEITPIPVSQAIADLIWDIKVLARAIVRAVKGKSGVRAIGLYGNQEQLANAPSSRENIDFGVTSPEVKVTNNQGIKQKHECCICGNEKPHSAFMGTHGTTIRFAGGHIAEIKIIPKRGLFCDECVQAMQTLLAESGVLR